MPSSLRWWPPWPAGRGPATPAGRPSPQPGEPWPTSADGRTCGHAARTPAVRDQYLPARPGTPVPWLPRRSDAVAFGTDLEGFCRREGGFGQRARGGDGTASSARILRCRATRQRRDRGQQPSAVAGRQRVASLELQAEPGRPRPASAAAWSQRRAVSSSAAVSGEISSRLCTCCSTVDTLRRSSA
jgi:hypothetical protein